MTKINRRTAIRETGQKGTEEKKPEEPKVPIEDEKGRNVGESGSSRDERISEEFEGKKFAAPDRDGAYSPLLTPWAESGAMPKKIALVVSVVLVICIIFLGYLFFNGMKGAINQSGGTRIPAYGGGDFVTQLPELPNETMPQTGPGWAECLTGYGLDPKAPIFTYLPTCPHCAKMKPIMAEVEKKGYSFNWVDRSDRANNLMLDKCLKGVAADAVPQLICPKTKASKLGELTENEVIVFAEACKSA